MPNVQWEWKVGPQTIISALMLLVMLGGLVGIFTSIETDIKVAQGQVTDLRAAVTALTGAQTAQAVDEASVKAKVDLILPMVQRLDDNVENQRLLNSAPAHP